MTDTQTEAKKLTADEFSRQVLEDKPRVAIFDCDGTLWSGDSGYGFMVWSLEQGLVSRSTSDWIDARYRSYCAGDIDEETICGEMVQMYAGLHERELQSAAAEYVRSFVLPRVFSEMATLVEDLTKAGTELWAVSSTNRWVVTEGVRAFGIPEERVLAADVIVVAGNITSTLKDVPTDEGKATALKRVGLSRPDMVFGNSLHDLAMLDLAAKAFPVNPSPGLLEAAASRGWGYFRPAAAEVVRPAASEE
ncbi:HAD family hydrolase [Telmatobacter bradus]|uniref:HAD family hydrolase n=1 Tax=Telmatobacter bradus TaxID=474953 RepID=UPI003B42EB8A